ncbi:MAG: choice-of-anchor B family protein [Phycisphaeraceae bacterium]|nr:choice-of-anchor B family protein [Phycisphaeraceae bacterium]
MAQNKWRRSLSVMLTAAGLVGICTQATHGADEDLRKLIGEKPAAIGVPAIAGMPRHGDPTGGGRNTFPTLNMTLYAWMPLSAFPPGNHSTGNDCWGYVSPSGREYAIMGLARGFGFVEITDPWNPVLVGVINGPNSLWHDVKVIGHHAYGVSEGGSGIQVMDMSQIDNGVVTLVQNKTQGGHSSTHNIAANVDSGYLYLVGTNINNGGLTAVSTADPDNPTIVGTWNAMYVHDAQIVTYTEGPFAGREIAFCLSGFNGGWNNTGLRIVDVTDKSNMFTISQAFWSGARYAHQGWLSEDRRHFYINDELDEGDTVQVTTTRIFDVSDINNPVYVGFFTSGAAATDHNLYTHQGKIFEANYKSGLRVFDKSNPAAPVQIAYFDTYPESDTSGFNGAWSTYPYFPSGTILISDLDRGLFIVRLDGVSIDYEGAPPTILTPNVATPIRVVVNPLIDQYNPDSVRLHYRAAEGSWQVAVMTDQGDSVFQGVLPGFACLADAEYYASVVTDKGTTVTTPVVGAKVISEIVVHFHDNFDTNKGWTAGAPDDNATAGHWSRMPPQQTTSGGAIVQPGWVVSGANCWVTDGRAGQSAGTYDVDNGKTTLFSPVFNLEGMDPVISYWRWFSNNAGSGAYSDVFVVDVSTNGGSTWTNFETVGPSGSEVGGGWLYKERRLGEVVSPTSTVRFRFVASDYNPQSLVEACIDDFRIVLFECHEPSCIADFNGDTVVNTLDVLAYLNAYSAGDSSADVNGDTVVNTLDLLAFLNLYNEGC